MPDTARVTLSRYHIALIIGVLEQQIAKPRDFAYAYSGIDDSPTGKQGLEATQEALQLIVDYLRKRKKLKFHRPLD